MKSAVVITVVSIFFLISGVCAAEPIWHAWGVHGATITVAGDGTITTVTGYNDNYHWDKSNWEGRTGQKAYYSTSFFNGWKVGQILDFSWDTIEGYWGNAYFNFYVEDINGKKAIIAPSNNSGTSVGWDDYTNIGDNYFSIFEAEAGWTGTAGTGWHAASWDEIKDLTIASGGPLELPDTLFGEATGQGDSAYSFQNWLAWAGLAGNSDAAYDGFAIVFGQSTGTDTPLTKIGSFEITYASAPVPEPGTVVLMGVGLLGLVGLRRFRKK